MNAIFQFELNQTKKRWAVYLMYLAIILLGVFCGHKFNLTAGEGIYLNSPYTVGFMTGMLSLSILFFAILFSNQLLFKEWDAKFEIMFFALPLSKTTYLNGKFWYFYLKTFLSFGVLILGFIIGQNLRTGDEMQMGFNLWHYVYPLLVFGLLNALFVCSSLFVLSYATQKKLIVVIGGLLLYVFYMVLLVFSNSPFMSGSLPQSIETQQISALLDPFGLSAYFFEARSFSVVEKNDSIVPLANMFLLNRLIFALISLFFLWRSHKLFSFSKNIRNKRVKKVKTNEIDAHINLKPLTSIRLKFGNLMDFKTILSFAKLDIIYLFKSVVIAAVSLLLIFYVGMEMYADVYKGIRLPEKYATSGLLATSISSNFHLLGLLILSYFVNDLYWRSHVSNFNLIENSIYFSKSKWIGHFSSASLLVCFFTILLIVEALVFQLSYGYFNIDWKAYLGVFVFNAFPLILFSGFLVLLNGIVNNRYVSLGISTLSVFSLASPLSKSIFSYPLFHIFSGFNGLYSDFNGYGIYISAFSQRLLFGLGLIVALWVIIDFIKTKTLGRKKVLFALFFVIIGTYKGSSFMNGYIPNNEEQLTLEAVNYEKTFRKYEAIPQPTITDVDTRIDLFPSKNAYQIEGKYVLKNLSNEPIHTVLFNFHPDLTLESATFRNNGEAIAIDNFVTEVKLKAPLLPNEEAVLEFKLSYQWFAVNGHQSFNAIVRNGSFMRVSNYYPMIGYQSDMELQDAQMREKYRLEEPTGLKNLEMPEVFKNDFINLNMVVSTEDGQTPIGIGNLKKSWSEESRVYNSYTTKTIPFRFAVASAKYQKKSLKHRDIDIEVLYDEKHHENVNRLLSNAVLSLDYCIDNFGPYPFDKISFVEVSAFTSGFAATTYPNTIFMTEHMVFHANIEADATKDVINELAGHELSHLWWGNSQINPDDREGATVLTETLAMYTEMMIYKKLYGKENMMNRVQIHQQIYDNEKGLYGNPPLYKVPYGATHIAYSKGAIVMVKLTELIGEDNVNRALKNFLLNNQYPKKPTSLDLIEEFYKVVPNVGLKYKIETLFKEI